MTVKEIHRFWAGPRPMPQEYVEYGLQWDELNPGWQVNLWTEQDLVDMVEHPLRPVLDSMYERDAGRQGIELFVQLADVMGYVLAGYVGGVYVNCDMQPVRPLPEMPDKAWASLENNEDGRIVNAAIGASRSDDPFWLGLLDALPARYFSNPTAEMVETTGPAFLTDYAHAHPDELHVFGVNHFNPVHWKQIPSGEDASKWRAYLPAETIALHHWGHKRDGRSNTIETATQ